jgi:hypothetical protein
MKPVFLLIALLAILISCSSGGNSTKEISQSASDYLLEHNSVNLLVSSNHQLIKDKKGNLISFKAYLQSLNDDSLTSIPYALDYIQTCMKGDTTGRDSVFLLFNSKFYAIVNQLSDSLDTKYKYLEDQMDRDSITSQLQNFKANLKSCGVDIFTTEGMYYLDVIPDFFYSNFKNRVSEGVREYLNIRKDELKEGFSEDAGLVISFEDVYKRVKRWENFMKQFPSTVYSEDANGYYSEYLQTLMSGMDNSRVFDFDGNKLLPEVKSIYEKILKEDSESQTTQIITSYYNFLSRHDFTENDSVPLFMKSNKLISMLGVQPDNR